MRSSTFYNFAFLATSLLAKDALAAPYDRRAVVNEEVVVTQVATVIQQADGSFVTQLPTAAPAVPVAEPTPEVAVPKQADKAVAPADSPASSPAASSPAPAPPASSPSSAPASPPSSGGSSLSSKRGLAYNDAGLLQGFVGSGSKATWCYNWDSRSGNVPSGLEYVPMLHGLDQDHLGPWVANANAAIAGGATHLQFINEPDIPPSQGGVSTSSQDAADGYIAHMMPFQGKAKIGSPAVSSSESANMGLAFLKDFWAKCSGCTFDFVPFHWYGPSAALFTEHVKAVYEAAKAEPKVVKDANGNPRLWITEFGMDGAKDGAIASFLKDVMPWLDGQDYVERYSYFWVAEDFLVSGGSPNTAGKAFAGLA